MALCSLPTLSDHDNTRVRQATISSSQLNQDISTHRLATLNRAAKVAQAQQCL